jgi:hypothetical protein
LLGINPPGARCTLVRRHRNVDDLTEVYRHCVDEGDRQVTKPPSASLTPTRSRRSVNFRARELLGTSDRDARGIDSDATRVLRDSTRDVDYTHKVFNYTNSLEVSSDSDIRESSVADETIVNDARFISDTNPEGVFFASGGSRTGSYHNVSTRRNVGVWPRQRCQSSRFSDRLSTTLPYHGVFHGLDAAIRDAILPVLERICLLVSPPFEHRTALCAIYFEKFNTMLPVVDRSVYDSIPLEHPSRLPLDQAMCMVAAMDPSSSSHLYISDGATKLSRSGFGHRLFTALRANIGLRRIEDRLLLVQLHALMSLFKEGSDAYENSMLTIARAVQHVHSLGHHLHLDPEHAPNDHAQKLFCCVWFLDRLNAALHGRPILMHERDNSRSIQDHLDAYEPSFRLLLRIGLLLDDVVSLYRPKFTDSELLNDTPLFEDLVVECQAVKVTPRVLGKYPC